VCRFGIAMQRCERLPWHGVRSTIFPIGDRGLITLVRGPNCYGLRMVSRLPHRPGVGQVGCALVVTSDVRKCANYIVEERGSCMDLQPTITAAIEEHLTVIHQLTAMSSLILRVASEVVETLRRQGKVVLCGNGGSASDAQHIAAEMQGIRDQPDTPQGLLALVLTENTALLTAISNDVGYPSAFRRQVEAIVRKDDLVIGL